ncbi:FAD-binding protein [Sporolactobacillus sp. THM7-4]|nr:FAD-binding protein [Sporolactobacillus sp. THM7-4]
MYDVVVIGQGLSGMLAAIWAKEKGKRTALIMSGAGKILQSTGVLDLIPGSDGTLEDWMKLYQMDLWVKPEVMQAVDKFKLLMRELGYAYEGDPGHPVPIVTGSGHIKYTALYPETVSPVPGSGRAVVVGFRELADFQPSFISKNLQNDRPGLRVSALSVRVGAESRRVLTQLDVARLLDQEDIRENCLNQIKNELRHRKTGQPDFFIFPSSLGYKQWPETLRRFSEALGATVTEAPGIPPNATAIRLNNLLKLKAIRSGVRFYGDTTVIGANRDNHTIRSVIIRMVNRTTEVAGSRFILATGGVLGGGLEVLPTGMRETALHLETDSQGRPVNPPDNLYLAGASRGEQLTRNGIVGGIYTLVSSYEAAYGACKPVRGGMKNA